MEQVLRRGKMKPFSCLVQQLGSLQSALIHKPRMRRSCFSRTLLVKAGCMSAQQLLRDQQIEPPQGLEHVNELSRASSLGNVPISFRKVSEVLPGVLPD